ncbi:MAG: hypothetical protein IJT15_00595 [Rickettsiales bacterium]|nr:hypothetical protein [Rickettsiales bacterium]
MNGGGSGIQNAFQQAINKVANDTTGNIAKAATNAVKDGALANTASAFFHSIQSPLTFSVVGQTIGHIMSVGERTRMQMISQMLKEEQFRNKILLVGEQKALDRVKFDENSVPIGSLGEELCVDGDKLVFFIDDQYNTIDLSQQAFKTMYAEETSNNSKMISILMLAMVSLEHSVFLSDQRKDSLHNAIQRYMDVIWKDNGSINFLTGIFRAVGNTVAHKWSDYTYEELEQVYEDYKAGKIEKNNTDGFKDRFFDYVKYFFGSRNKEKNRYIDIAEAFDELRQELVLSVNEIKSNLQHIKNKCVEKLQTMNPFKEPRKSELFTRITKSKVLLQRLYMEYKNNGQNIDNALLKVANELYRRNELVQDKSLLSNEQNNGIRKIEKRHMQYATSDEEVNEQVRRYFNFDPNVTRSIKLGGCEIILDKYSKIIEIQNSFNNVYYLDFNQLRNDIDNSCVDNKNGGVLYYRILLETLQKITNDSKYMFNSKTAKIMQYIESTVSKIENKALKDDEYEYLPNMLFHWISSLTNRPITQQNVDKKIVTVTFMDSDDKDKTSKHTDENDENIDDFQNVAFDIFDPKTEKMKMGTIIRKGEKIYYKEDPGMSDFKVVSAEELMTKLDIQALQGKDIEKEYTGDCWNMRKMLDFVQKLRDKEQQKQENVNKSIKKTASYISDGVSEDINEYSKTRVSTEEGAEKQDFLLKNISNSMPINKLGRQLVMTTDDNNDNNVSLSNDIKRQQDFTGNTKSNMSYKIPSMNLQNENLSATLNQ